MKFVSMKIPAKSRDNPTLAGAESPDAPAYPYGLSVNLNDDSLEQLGLDADTVEVGQKFLLCARVEVTAISKQDSKDGGADQSISLQITDMALEPPGAGGPDKAAAFYKDRT